MTNGLGVTPRRSGPRRAFVSLLLGLVGLGAVLSAWALSSPVGSSPDDDFHLASIWCQQGNSSLCRPGASAGSRQVSSQIASIYCFAQKPEIPANCEMVNLNAVGSFVETERGNFQHEYPTGFYTAMSTVATSDVVSSVITMRLINALIFVLLIASALIVSVGRQQTSFAWPWIAVISPLALFLIPSTNPSSWAITGAGLAWYFLLRGLSSKGWRRILSISSFLACALLASQARVDAGVFVVISSTFVLALWWKNLESRKLGVGLLIFSLLCALLSWVSAGQLSAAASGGLTDADVTTHASNGFALLGFNSIQLPEYFAGMFGLTGLGWTDTQMPAVVWLIGFLIVFATIFQISGKLQVRDLAVSLTFGSLIIAISLYMFQTAGAHVGAIVQPRYIYPLLISLFGAIWYFGIEERAVRFSNFQYIVISVSVFISMCASLFINMSRYLQGQATYFVLNLNSFASGSGTWWFAPIQPLQLWLLGTVGSALLILTLLVQHLRLQSAIASSVEEAN